MEMNISKGLRSFRVLRFFAFLAKRCWTLASGALLICLLFYWAYGGISAFLLLCFAITGILYHAEDRLLFHPEQPPHSRVFVPVPSMFGLPFENIFIRSFDGILLNLYFIRQSGDLAVKAPTILFLHGNAGNMGHRLQNVVGLYYNLQCNILMLDYRGYGLSQGSPSEEGLTLDAKAALDFLFSRNDVNHEEIVVFGRSLGGAVAVDLAHRPEYACKIWCLILENTFTSIPDMAKVLIRWKFLQYIPLCFYKNKFLSLWKIDRLTMPTAFISGMSDTLVPPRMMVELHQFCGSPYKQILHFESGTHNFTWATPGYYEALSAFLKEVKARRIISKIPEAPSDIKCV